MDQSSTTLTSDTPDSGDAESETGDLLSTVASEPQTIYVLAGDVLVLPCGPNPNVGAMADVHKHLEVAEIVLTEGIDRPWILRKATLANNDTAGVPNGDSTGGGN